MKILLNYDELGGYIAKGAAVALGNFDGLHKAHMEVLRAAIKYAKLHDCISIAYMFKDHPKNKIDPEKPIKYITPNKYKEKILAKIGIDLLFFEKFSNQLREKSPYEFVLHLKNTFHVKCICVGYNYSFGYGASGDVSTLREVCNELEIDLVVADEMLIEGEAICSTRIRALLEIGDVKTAAKYLGRAYFVYGEVLHGRKFGTNLGFPTINTHVHENAFLPKNGVYLTKTWVDAVAHKSLTNVGTRPTVGGTVLTVETYILDFSGDLYGNEVTVDFVDRIRDEIKFDSFVELKKQIEIDVKSVMDIEI